jgi:hypothetical protein
MYSKEEFRQIKVDFWSGFKNHMAKKRSVTGKRINWLQYPSDIPFIFIRSEVDEHSARFSLDIQHKDAGVRAIIWEQLIELKIVLESEMGTSGKWLEHQTSPAVPNFDRICWERTDLSIHNLENKEEIYAFLENRLVCFDAFYQEFKDIIINLAL